MILIGIFFRFNSLVILWILIELNLIFFIIIILNSFYSFLEGNTEQSLFYLIVQTIGSILFLMGLVFTDFFKFLDLDNNFLILFSLILKLGLFPFHQWVYRISAYISTFTFLILLTIQKVPLLFVIFSFNIDILILIAVFNLLFGSFFIIKSYSIKELLVSSSIYSTI